MHVNRYTQRVRVVMSSYVEQVHVGGYSERKMKLSERDVKQANTSQRTAHSEGIRCWDSKGNILEQYYWYTCYVQVRPGFALIRFIRVQGVSWTCGWRLRRVRYTWEPAGVHDESAKRKLWEADSGKETRILERISHWGLMWLIFFDFFVVLRERAETEPSQLSIYHYRIW